MYFNKSRFTLTHLRAVQPKTVLQLHAAVSGRWGNGQFLAHRLDPYCFIFLHKFCCLRPDSAWAKKAAALRRISLLRLNP
ncbi:MAG: hypothetical protein ACFNTM_03030 [Cardiobacterium sp.]